MRSRRDLLSEERWKSKDEYEVIITNCNCNCTLNELMH